jgi:hypothetical protein
MNRLEQAQRIINALIKQSPNYNRFKFKKFEKENYKVRDIIFIWTDGTLTGVTIYLNNHIHIPLPTYLAQKIWDQRP